MFVSLLFFGTNNKDSGAGNRIVAAMMSSCLSAGVCSVIETTFRNVRAKKNRRQAQEAASIDTMQADPGVSYVALVIGSMTHSEIRRALATLRRMCAGSPLHV